MPILSANLRTALTVSAALALGYAAHSIPTLLHRGLPVVQAQSRGTQGHAQAGDDFGFQFGSITPPAALTLYSPSEHTLYVYTGVNDGNSHISCAFMLHVTQPGAPIDRKNCDIGSFVP